MKAVRTHSFNNRKYKIIISPPIDGQCTTYKLERELWIIEHPKTKNFLVTAIHEALHACSWSAKEELVTITAKDIARFLWRLNFRRVK